MKIALGLFLGFCIGIFCRIAGIPLPAPPVLSGALLVLSMTTGFVLVDRFCTCSPLTTKKFCGGPTGKPPSEMKEGAPQ